MKKIKRIFRSFDKQKHYRHSIEIPTLVTIPILTALCYENWKRLGLSNFKICSSKRLWKNQIELIWGDTHMVFAQRGVGGLGKSDMLSDVGEWGLASVLEAQSFFFIKQSWICAMTRHHANNILLAKNLPFDSDVRQWSHPLMILLHCCGLNTNNQFECELTLLLFCCCCCCCCFCSISFIHMHGVVDVP